MGRAYYYIPKKESSKTRPKKSFSWRNLKAAIIILFIIVAVLALLKASKEEVTETGEVIYDSSLSSDERTKLENLVKENGDETKNISFLATETTSLDNLPKANDETAVAVAVYVPTVDFYDSRINISASELPSISTAQNAEIPNANQSTSSDSSNQTTDYSSNVSSNNETDSTASTSANGITLVNLNNLTSKNRVVSVDNNYYFDNPKLGAKFRVIEIKSASEKLRTKYEEDIRKTFGDIPENSSDFLSFAQTGVTALTRAMTTALNTKAGGRGSYFADNIKDFLSTKDLTHISNEISFADNCKGGTDDVSLCADWRSLDSITAIGTDIVELTGNHNNDYGMKDNIATINKYKEMGLKLFGGGLNEEEAAKPLELDEKGQKITLLGYNNSTSTKANGQIADGDDPGANGYTEEKAEADISAAKARGDFVIVDVQFFECYSYPDGYVEMLSCDAPISGQQSFFRHLIDLGADMVVGTQAHQPQTFEYYNNKPIYYGLGNLFFDQTYWPGTQRGIILTHYFRDGKLLNTRLSPTWYDENYQVSLLDQSDSESFISRLINSSPRGE